MCLLGLFDVSRPQEIAHLSGAGNVTSISRTFNPKGVQNGRTLDVLHSVPMDGLGQVLFLVEIIEAGGFNQQQARLASPYRASSPSAVRS